MLQHFIVGFIIVLSLLHVVQQLIPRRRKGKKCKGCTQDCPLSEWQKEAARRKKQKQKPQKKKTWWKRTHRIIVK